MKTKKTKTPSGADWSAADIRTINELVSKIDINNTDGVLKFGVTAQRQISGFSERILDHVRAKDAGHVRDLLKELMQLMKRLNVSRLQEDSVLARVPFVGTRMGVSDRFFTEYEKISQQVERVSERLEEERGQLLRDIELFDKLYQQNLDQLKQVEIYIVAAELKLEELNEHTIPRMKTELEGSDNPMDKHRLDDFLLQVRRLEEKLKELRLTRTISVQSAGEIRMIQGGMEVLIEGIQSSTLNSVPLWRTQISIAMARARQKRTQRLQQEITGASNAMLKRSSDVLRSAGVETVEVSEPTSPAAIAPSARPAIEASPNQTGAAKVKGPAKPARAARRRKPAKPARTAEPAESGDATEAAGPAAQTEAARGSDGERKPAKPSKPAKPAASVSMRALHDGT